MRVRAFCFVSDESDFTPIPEDKIPLHATDIIMSAGKSCVLASRPLATISNYTILVAIRIMSRAAFARATPTHNRMQPITSIPFGRPILCCPTIAKHLLIDSKRNYDRQFVMLAMLELDSVCLIGAIEVARYGRRSG